MALRTRWVASFLLLSGACVFATEVPDKTPYMNSVGMTIVRVEPGPFAMGKGLDPLPSALLRKKGHFARGDFDEHPSHTVRITKSFFLGVYEVTNAQYERFDPAHREQRGRAGLSREDDEPVLFVSWHDAVRYCEWLSEREGLPYRLPTEAEWEYACRGGTSGPFSSGDTVPELIRQRAEPEKNDRRFYQGSLRVGESPPNAWGLHDMHGNVEEWCRDWYGPYADGSEVDPIGPAGGDFRVTRGGSHSTFLYHLRSANRAGALPDDRQRLIGFRVALGELPATQPRPLPELPRWRRDVRPGVPPDLTRGPDPAVPYFKGPRSYVKVPGDGPLFAGGHDHFAAVVECPNGDLLAAWFNCREEMGRELGVAASRLRYGEEDWQPASVFWDCPDRNDHTHALWNDGRGTLYHFNGHAIRYRELAVVMRTSRDSGATWSPARLIYPDHDARNNRVVESVFQLNSGEILLPADGRGGTVISLSADGGQTWKDPGGSIRGTHGGVTQLTDGTLLALGRHGGIEGRMPMSLSRDQGKTWVYSPTPFDTIHSGQRLALLKLREGGLFLASFTKRTMVRDVSGRERPISGLYASLSLDDGKTWPHRRLVSDDGPEREIPTMDGHPVTLSAHRSEPVGYLSVDQGLNGVIHLVSSHEHYAFNRRWLMTLPPVAVPEAPSPARKLAGKSTLSTVYMPRGVPSAHAWRWRFNGRHELQVAGALVDGGLRLALGEKEQCWWRSDEAFRDLDPERGFTAEIRARIVRRQPGQRGLGLELYDGAGSRYALVATDSGVYWYEGRTLGSHFLNFAECTPVVEGVDNSTEAHTFRLAVRPDRVVQIYRDGELLGHRRYEYRTPRDAYIQFDGAPGLEAVVEHVAYDLRGAWQP